MEDKYSKLDQDLQDVREAVDKFILQNEDSDNDQAKQLIKMLKDIKVEGLLKSQEDYADYTYSSYEEEYYISYSFAESEDDND